MTILAVYTEEPAFPSTDQHPDAARYHVGGLWVDATGGEQPSQAEIEALISPNVSLADQVALNAALSAEGSVVRALALVLLQEINTIRGKLSPTLPAYTQAQLVAALKAKMR